MTPLKRLTPEREAEIRSSYCFSTVIKRELESEIDALRVDYRNSMQDTCDVLKERDALKAENEKLEYKLACLLKHATGGLYSNPRYTIEDMYHQVDDHVEREIEKALAQDDACIDSKANSIHSKKDVSDEK